MNDGERDTRDLVRAVWEAMRPTAHARVALIGDAVERLRRGALPDDERAEAETAAHKLAGALGTYGYPEGSRLARRIEHRLAEPDPRQHADELAELHHALANELAD